MAQSQEEFEEMMQKALAASAAQAQLEEHLDALQIRAGLAASAAQAQLEERLDALQIRAGLAASAASHADAKQRMYEQQIQMYTSLILQHNTEIRRLQKLIFSTSSELDELNLKKKIEDLKNLVQTTKNELNDLLVLCTQEQNIAGRW
jgi:hypothetical protein